MEVQHNIAVDLFDGFHEIVDAHLRVNNAIEKRINRTSCYTVNRHVLYGAKPHPLPPAAPDVAGPEDWRNLV